MTETGVRPELVPPELLKRVVRFFDPELVILFGSRARGEAGEDSDYDLLVVVSDDTPVEKRRLRAGYEARAGWSGSVDIIPCTRSGFERQRNVVGTLAEIAVHEGSSSMPGIDLGRQAREARRWVARADLDATGAERLLTGTPSLPSVAAFHCQQAAEKLLKAALVRVGVRPRKTHDLTSLADEAARLLPTLTPLADRSGHGRSGRSRSAIRSTKASMNPSQRPRKSGWCSTRSSSCVPPLCA